MPVSYQIIPENLYPHRTVVVNDNSVVTATPSSDSGDTRLLCVFASPKGVDGKVRVVDGGAAQFLKDYGMGPFSIYGQPLLNAYNAALSGAATLNCLRIAANDASYGVLHVIAKYKVTDIMNEEEVPEKIGATLDVKFEIASGSSLTNLDNLESSYTAPTEPDINGFTTVKLFSVAYIGKGAWGNNIKVRITSDSTNDRVNTYKNYNFEVYENDGGLIQRESFSVVFNNEDAIVDGNNIFADAKVNDTLEGSEYVKLISFVDGFNAIYTAYKTEFDDTVLTADNFDVFLGIDKTTKAAITHYVIDTSSEGVIAVNDLAGITLAGGSDGSFGAGIAEETRATALDNAYKAAFGGTTDPMIKSKNKFPTDIILDANYSEDVKVLIAALATTRKDCVAIIDCGTGITTKASVLTYVNENLDTYVRNRVHTIEAYAGKIKDPYSKKIVTVTGTYGLAAAYPVQFQSFGGKHVPLAGNTYGIIGGYLADSIYPIFDEDIDSDVMNELCEARVNFARINAAQNVIRATQTTRQIELSYLSEVNNVFVLNDIKRDCEKICATNEFNFADTNDIVRFNKMIENILPKYSMAQVKSISAKFDKNAWESERSIIHLYVEMVCRDLVKSTIIEIDVNR